VRKILFAALTVTLGALVVLSGCDPEDTMSDFPVAQYMDQAFSIFVTDDSFDNYCGAHAVLDFEGDGNYGGNVVVPTYITEMPTIDGVLDYDEFWNPEYGEATWTTIDLEHKPYASGYDDPDNAPSSFVVDEVMATAGINVAGGSGTLYMAFQWTDPSGTDDHYENRWRFYKGAPIPETLLPEVLRQVTNGMDPWFDDWPQLFNDPDFPFPDGYHHGYSSDTLGLVWDIWGVEDPEADNPMPAPSVDGFFENGWDICWYQDGDEYVCKLTPDMGTYENTPMLDVWWWSAARTNWQPPEIQSWAYMEDMYQTSEDTINDHGVIPDNGFGPYRYNYQIVKAGEYYIEEPLFKHQEQPDYLFYPDNPEWIYMDYISWGSQGPDKFGPGKDWHMGDEVPGYAALSSTLGSGGDVIAKASFDEETGVWSLEVQRLFNTDQADDAALGQYHHTN
jgi:hypothetical protein